MTQKELFAAVRALGLTITRTEGGDEYRLAFPLSHYDGDRAHQRDRQEGEAYYGDDARDILGTAVAMLKAADAERENARRVMAWSTLDMARD